MLFSRYFQTEILKNSYKWNETCEKASPATENVSILELRMPYFFNLEL